MLYNRPLQGLVEAAGQYNSVAEAHTNLLAAKCIHTPVHGSLMLSACPILFFSPKWIRPGLLQGECGLRSLLQRLRVVRPKVCPCRFAVMWHVDGAQAQISAFTARLMV